MQTPALPSSAVFLPELSFPHFTQDTRLLRLTTPLGPDVLLAECVRGEEGLSELFRFKIAALSVDAAIPLKALIGQPVLLELLTAHSRDQLRPFHGHITSIALTGANGGFARYNLTLEPWTAFLAHGRDSRIFQDRTVVDIIDSVLGAYRGKGTLAPAWRFDLLDPDVYTTRSTVTQYQESDLAFVERLMHEEGLFYYFEHSGDAGNAPFGSHTLVIADHNGSFVTNRQAAIAFTQPGATMQQDSLDRWRTEIRAQTDAVELLSWDYRALDVRTVSAVSANASGELVSRDTPGVYAYASRAHGQRIADRQMQALEAGKEVHVGAGTVRTLAPGTTFTLTGHPRFNDDGKDDARSFLTVHTVHLMHNNLDAELAATSTQHLGQSVLDAQIADEKSASLHALGKGPGQRPLYRVRIDAIRSKVPYRSRGVDAHGQLLHPRPSVRGQQTAIVVGPSGATLHTDRDHRIKVQFHWQRGTQSHARLAHPAPDGHADASADDRAGTWVRVATPLAPVAGANWGSNALPRVGQEVLIDFLEGDIDRPVVIGALYNGRGQQDAQHNQVSAGAGAASGNAPAWFPGQAGSHAHPAVLSGIKTQALQAAGGAGPYSQLVFDDSPGQARIALQRHAQAHGGTAELNLGHLPHQSDNARLPAAGFGAELKTGHSAALRAGSGLLLSTHARGSAAGDQMDSREASEQVRQSAEMQTALVELAQKHHATLKNEPAPPQLAALRQLEHVDKVLTGDGALTRATAGAADKSAATEYAEPQLQLSAPDGIAAVTPASAIFSAGATSNFAAGHALEMASQGNSFHAVTAGIGLFTYGKIGSPQAPNQETGIRLHAASGKVSMQSQSDETRITADKAITVASVTKVVSIGASTYVAMTAQGASLRLEGGDITLAGPGVMAFKASVKELTGPMSVSNPDIASRVSELDIKRDLEIEYIDADGNLLSDEPIEIILQNGKTLNLTLDATGNAIAKNIPLGPLSAKQPKRK